MLDFVCLSCVHVVTDISVETIASFNKMKSLTTDIKMIVQVMKSSNLLEVHIFVCLTCRCVSLITVWWGYLSFLSNLASVLCT